MNTRLLFSLVLVFVLSLSSCAPATSQLIVQHPQTLLLTMADLPTGTKYYIPDMDPADGSVPNELYLTQLGTETGGAMLKETGRVAGWRVFYQRLNADDPGISTFFNVVGLFRSAEGARKFVSGYNPAALNMTGYELIKAAPNVGEESVVLLYKSQNTGYEAMMRYRVQFAYRNAAVTMEMTDVESKLKLDDAVRYANLLLERLKVAQMGTVDQLSAVASALVATPGLLPTLAPTEPWLATRTPGAYAALEFAPVTPISIARKPQPADFGRGKLPELPVYDPNSGEMWQEDLRGYDLTELDLTGRLQDLLFADFDSRTRWPAPEKLPAGFDRQQIMELGKDPGLGLRALHAQGITGQGVGIAIIDQTLLVDHEEYAGRLKLYEENGEAANFGAQMHGPAVASIAVGKTVGVAPGADLYYIADGCYNGSEVDYACLANMVRRVLEINQTLPAGQKIRVISMSIGWTSNVKGYQEIMKAMDEAKATGIFVISTSLSEVYGFYSMGLGRDPLADPDRFTSYDPGIFWAKSFYTSGLHYDNCLYVPMDARTVASPTGPQDFVFYREGGMSWAVPYVAGMYALAAQVKPSITPQEFWNLALKTGRPLQVSHTGKLYGLNVVLDPAALIEAIEAGG